MYYLGVAFNGDYIQFMLIDELGSIHGVQDERHVDLFYDGKQRFRGTIESGIARVCLKADIPFSDIIFSYFAIPSYGENDDFDESITNVLDIIFPKNNYICDNDVEAAWAGSLLAHSGITILVGTGSIAIGKNYKNVSMRVGGWGHLAGDEAGEYWLAKKILEIFTKESDGRYESQVLYKLFKEKLHIDHDFEMINFDFEHLDDYNVSFDDFFQILLDSFYAGDPYVKEVLEKSIEEYALLIGSLLRRMHFKSPITISYLGKIFQVPFIVAGLKSKLDDFDINYVLQAPVLSLVSGAALRALMFRKNITYSELIQLLNEENRLKELQV